MAMDARFANDIVLQLLELSREVLGLKYVFLKVVESHAIPDGSKLAYKREVTEIAALLHTHYNELRFRDINRFNVDEADQEEARFARQAGRRIGAAAKKGVHLSPVRVDPRRIPVSEAAVDSGLLSARIFEEPALEKDKLDRLNAVKTFLEQVAGPPRPQGRGAAASPERDLMTLKIRAFAETFAALEARNLDILYKVRTKAEQALSAGIRTNVVTGEPPDPARLNYHELYVQDLGGTNFSLLYRDRTVWFELKTLMTGPAEAGRLVYHGEISGWAEAGPNRVTFWLKDRGVPRVMSSEEAGERAHAFLLTSEMEEIYRRILELSARKAQEEQILQEKVERQMKDKVSRALDELL